jgi:hypothetical protein
VRDIGVGICGRYASNDYFQESFGAKRGNLFGANRNAKFGGGDYRKAAKRLRNIFASFQVFFTGQTGKFAEKL